MPPRHRLVAVAVAVLWGVNFVAIHASLEHFPPFLLVALRWTLLAVPTVLLVPRPRVKARWLVGYGLGFGVAQFAFLYTAMAAGMPAGLASLVLQASAPFTVLLATALLRERMTRRRLVGVVAAVGGLAIVGASRWSAGADLLPFTLTVLGAVGWAVGNLCSRRAETHEPFRFTMWMTVVPPIPMAALAVVVEGPDRIGAALSTALDPAARPAVLGLLYTCLLGTVLASGLWTWLLGRHPASVVAPYSMLVPVTGFTVAWLALGQRPAALEVVGGVVVVAGVLLGSLTPRRDVDAGQGRRRGPRSRPCAPDARGVEGARGGAGPRVEVRRPSRRDRSGSRGRPAPGAARRR